MILSNLIQERMLELNMSKAQLSDAAGLPYMTVSNIIQRGASKAGTQNVFRICAVLGISCDYLLELFDTSEAKGKQEDNSIGDRIRKDSVGARIKNARSRIGLTQDDLAKALDVSRSTVGMWESNHNGLKMSMVHKIEAVLNTELSQPANPAVQQRPAVDAGSPNATDSAYAFTRMIQAITQAYWELPDSMREQFRDRVIKAAFSE